MTTAELALLQLVGLSARLRREAAPYLFWGKFKGNIGIEGSLQNNDLNLTFSEMPIEANRELYLQGFGNTMILPTKREYTGPAKFGDDVLVGSEEDTGYTWTQVHFNQIRHAVHIRKGRQQELVERALQAAEQEMPQTARYFAKMENWMATASAYEGVSENLSAPQDTDGLGIAKRYHPNSYYVSAAGGNGAITKIGAQNKFPTGGEIDTMAGIIDATYTIKCAELEALRYLCMDLQIEPIITKDGNKFWIMIMHPKQAAILKTDSVWINAMHNAFSGKEFGNNPIFTGAIGFYAGFAIFEDPIIVRGWDVANHNFLGLNKFGNPEDLSTSEQKYNRRFSPFRSASGNRGAIVLGKSALGFVEAEPLQYRTDDMDYQNIKGLAGVANYGYSRLDQVSQAELQFLTNAPSNITSVTNDGGLILYSAVTPEYTP